MPTPFIPRFRPTKTFTKYLKYAWKPPPTAEQRAWGRAALQHLRHQADIRPDAFLPLSDLVSLSLSTLLCLTFSQSLCRHIPEASPNEIINWVKRDRSRRLEVMAELDRINGGDGWHKTWYIRAREGHTVPVRCAVSPQPLPLTSGIGC